MERPKPMIVRKPRTGFAAAHAELDDFCRDFANRVRALPYVDQVLLERDVPRIWTVIDAEPFERANRDPIYTEELHVLRDHPDQAADFRLINVREYECKVDDQILPREIETVWTRSQGI